MAPLLEISTLVIDLQQPENDQPFRSWPPPLLDPPERGELLSYFINTWDLQELLFHAVQECAVYYANPDPMRHTLLFYLGHPAAFYVKKLQLAGALARGVEPRFDDLFADDPDDRSSEEVERKGRNLSWPSIAAVWEYRDMVFETVAELLETLPLGHVRSESGPIWALLMAMEHDRRHFESTADIIRRLPLGCLSRPPEWRDGACTKPAPQNRLIEIPPGEVILGKRRGHPTFGWDIEYGERKERVRSFLASCFCVTNSEFLEFVESGGYCDERLWRREGWRWRWGTQAVHPNYWIWRDNEYSYRALFDEWSFPAAFPVEVNNYEAEAFCSWRGPEFRLLTEAEWSRATCDHDKGFRHVPENDPMLGLRAYNLNLRHCSPFAVDSSPPNPLGLYDAHGNVWQWLADDFMPLPGFEGNELSAEICHPPIGVRQKHVAGGSWATTGTGASKFTRCGLRRSACRNTGFRLAR